MRKQGASMPATNDARERKLQLRTFVSKNIQVQKTMRSRRSTFRCVGNPRLWFAHGDHGSEMRGGHDSADALPSIMTSVGVQRVLHERSSPTRLYMKAYLE